MGNLGAQSTAVKGLLIGDSGIGKTGALWSLAKAGYKLVIADFDNGLDILKVLAKSDPKTAERIYTEQFMDKFDNAMNVAGIPSAFTNFGKWLDALKGEGYDLGKLSTLDESYVFCVDSLTHCGNAALRMVMALSGHLNKQASLPDWGGAQTKIENLLGTLYSPVIKCNVLVLAHVNYITFKETGQIRGLPMAPGDKLSPKIPGYFNTLIYATKSNGKRVLKTDSSGLVEAKVPAIGLPAELPQDTGLVNIFQALRGAPPHE